MQVMRAFVDQHRDQYGVEPICKVLRIAPSGYRRHAAQGRNLDLRCQRAKRDEILMTEIRRVWEANLKVYGADKVWHQLTREGIAVARCTVDQLHAESWTGLRRNSHSSIWESTICRLTP